jgi:hypothetical protein
VLVHLCRRLRGDVVMTGGMVPYFILIPLDLMPVQDIRET